MNGWTDSYHNSEDVTVHGLMIQPLSGVQSARSGVQSELPQAERIRAAQECVGQFVLLIFVHSTDHEDFSPFRFIFRNVYNVNLLGELWPVVVGVNDTNKHLQEEKKNVTFPQRIFKWLFEHNSILNQSSLNLVLFNLVSSKYLKTS